MRIVVGAFLVLVQCAAAAVAQGSLRRDEIRELVYCLVDPRGRLLVKEQLLEAGAAALPPLVKAVRELDFRHGNRGWSDINRNPALSQKESHEIRAQAVAACLHVLQEMGVTARPALGDLLAIWNDYPSITKHPRAATSGYLFAAISSIARQSGARDLPLGAWAITKANPLQFDPSVPNSELLECIRKSISRHRATAKFRAACDILGERAADVVRDTSLRRRLVILLERILRRDAADPRIWPMFEGKRWHGQDERDYQRTLKHDYAALLLARIDSRRPLAIRGIMIQLVNIRHRVRQRAAIELGKRGGLAASATYCLIERLDDPVPRVKQAVIVSLGMIGPAAKAAIPHLRSIAVGKEKRLMVPVKIALGSIDPNPADTWTYYHYNGKRQAEGKCVEGTKTGRWTYWNFDGGKQWEGSYVDGKMHGKWVYYGLSGALNYRYDRGRIVPRN